MTERKSVPMRKELVGQFTFSKGMRENMGDNVVWKSAGAIVAVADGCNCFGVAARGTAHIGINWNKKDACRSAQNLQTMRQKDSFFESLPVGFKTLIASLT